MSKRPIEDEDNVCSFFLEKKKRPCRMKTSEGMNYCPHHSHLGSIFDPKKGPRIPCPLDSSHFCYESVLQKHLKKCNAREKEKPEYYAQNINNEIRSDSENFKITIGDISDEDLIECIRIVKDLYNELKLEIATVTASHPVMKEEMDKIDDGFNAFKHMKQQASLLSILQEKDLLKDDICYVEFGAGKGELMYWIVKCVRNPQTNAFVLIDKSTQRHKSDNKFKGSDIQIERIRIDIQHLKLGNVPTVKPKLDKVVAACKHLCGGATDLALRCLINTLTPEETDKYTKSRALGLLMALCCHHRCTWDSYVGKAFMKSHNVTESQFKIMCCMASWYTCGLRKTAKPENPVLNEEHTGEPEEQDVNRYTRMNLSHEERETIGFQCKRILDAGRCYFLQENGYDANLISYIDKSVSLENIALIATQRR